MNALKYLPRFRSAGQSLVELAVRESWSRSEIEAHQLVRLNSLWQEAIVRVPYYRALHSDKGLPESFTDLDHFRTCVPILKKPYVRDNAKTLLSKSAGSGGWHHTSGSSGFPTPIFRTHRAHHELLCSRYRFNQMWGVDILDRWAFLWGNAESLAPGFEGFKALFTTPAKDRLRGRLRLSPYDLSKKALRSHLNKLAAFKPAAIYSHSMAADLLAREAEAVGFKCPSLKLVVLTAEPIRQSTVAIVEKAFGVPAVAEYGAVECGFIAGEAKDRTLRVREDTVVLETIPAGDQYEIVATVLNSHAFPLIRYALGDVVEQPLELPEQGFAILPPVYGRNFDLIVTKTGSFLHGQIFEDILDKFSAIRCWQLKQTAEGNVEADIECDGDLDDAAMAFIQTQFSKYLEGFEVTIRQIEGLSVSRSGKHRNIVSELGVVLAEQRLQAG
ncbi:MAG: hypothetical protein AAF434_05195 [Pseudomonadota bacterium]